MLQASKSAARTPGALRASSAMLALLSQSPGTALPPRLASAPSAQVVISRCASCGCSRAARSSCSLTGSAGAAPISRSRPMRSPSAAAVSSAIAAPKEWPTSAALSASTAASKRPIQPARSDTPASGGPCVRPWPGKIDGQHGVTVPGAPARWQLPVGVVLTGTMNKEDNGLARIEGSARPLPRTPVCRRR